MNRTSARTARRTTIAAGVLAAVTSGLAGGLATSAHAAPTWLPFEGVTPVTALPEHARVAVAPSGTAVAVWEQAYEGVQQIFASTRPVGGAWSTPVQVSTGGASAIEPEIAVSGGGVVAAAWRAHDGAEFRVQTANLMHGGGWSIPEWVSPEGKSAYDPQVDVLSNTSVVVAYTAEGGGLELGINPSGYAPTIKTVTAEGVGEFDMDMNNNGKVVVVWTHLDADNDAVRARTYWGSFGPTMTLASGINTSGFPSVAVNDDGEAQAAYLVNGVGQSALMSKHLSAVGLWGPADQVNENSELALSPSVAIAADGSAALSWKTNLNEVQFTTLPAGGAWGDVQTLGDGGAATAPTTLMNDRGDAAVHWGDNTPRLRVGVRAVGADTMTTSVPISSPVLVPAERAGGLDDQGNLHLVYVVELAENTGRLLSKVYDVTGPSAAMSAPTAYRTNKTAIPVAWSVADRYSAATPRVLVRSAAWNGGFGLATLWKSAGTSATYAGTPGRTYCFAVQGVDAVGNEGAQSGWRCTTTPTDDRKASGFIKKKATGYFQGTYRTASAKGSVLKLKGVQADRLSLLVAKGKGHGKVAVYFAGKKLGTWSLAASSTKRKQQIQVADFPSVKTGTLKVVVVSSGKPVRIDGFHVAR